MFYVDGIITSVIPIIEVDNDWLRTMYIRFADTGSAPSSEIDFLTWKTQALKESEEET